MTTPFFTDPHEIQLDRRPNPHIAFGAGAHFCLGAGHARMLVKTLLQEMCKRVKTLTLIDFRALVENEAEYQRKVGYHSLTVSVTGI